MHILKGYNNGQNSKDVFRATRTELKLNSKAATPYEKRFPNKNDLEIRKYEPSSADVNLPSTSKILL